MSPLAAPLPTSLSALMLPLLFDRNYSPSAQINRTGVEYRREDCNWIKSFFAIEICCFPENLVI